MTLTERVLRHLEETKGEWVLEGGRYIRFGAGGCCPVESLYGYEPEDMHADTATDDELEIMRASDKYDFNLGPLHDPALRAAMLEAAGLAEEALRTTNEAVREADAQKEMA